VHAFRQFGLISAMGSCKIATSRSSLKPPTDYSRYCGACLLIEEGVDLRDNTDTIAWPTNEDDE
jgi:hypothetical protein